MSNPSVPNGIPGTAVPAAPPVDWDTAVLCVACQQPITEPYAYGVVGTGAYHTLCYQLRAREQAP